MQIREITEYLDSFAPASLMEDYDNVGLLIGNKDAKCSGVLTALELTQEVLQEAVQKKTNLIVTHHPIIFHLLRKLTDSNYVEKLVAECIRKNISVYAMHTNLDSIREGVNKKLADKIGLVNLKFLDSSKSKLYTISVFVPSSHWDKVREAMANAGAGVIGNYTECSFSAKGTGTYRPNEKANPYSGKSGKLSKEEEYKLEMSVASHRLDDVISAMKKAHPYEEVAYDIFLNERESAHSGMGMFGELKKEMSKRDFLNHVKRVLNTPSLRHSDTLNTKIKKVALCGGAGSSLLSLAIQSGADAFITADVSYHRFFDAEGKILFIDAGHYETEKFTPELISEKVKEKFPNFVVFVSKVNTNPVKYF